MNERLARLVLNDVLSCFAQTFDTHSHHITGLQITRWLKAVTHTGGGARHNNVAQARVQVEFRRADEEGE